MKQPLIKPEPTPLEVAEDLKKALDRIKKIGWRKFCRLVISERGFKSRKEYAQKTGICETVFYNDCPRCLSQFDVFFAEEKK